jgi:hypothetical protein
MTVEAVKVSEKELQALVNLVMTADPYPEYPGSAEDEKAIKELADRISEEFHFENWVDAYHNVKP